MVERVLFAPGGATEPKQDQIITALTAVLNELQDKFEAGQQVALDTATLAALETVTVSGNVSLDSATLDALESVTAVVANMPDDFPDTAVLSALGVIQGLLGGTLTVDDGHPDPQTDALTDAELRASQVDVADSGEREYTPVVATVSNAGDTVVHTPGPGKRIRLRWLYAINDPTATNSSMISVRLGDTEIYRVWALSKRQVFTGDINASLIVNLSDPATVAVSALIEEI